MPGIINGEHKRNWRLEEKSGFTQLPPVDTLHGVDMPGGNLHKVVTEHSAGFMSPRHVERIQSLEEEIEKRPIFDLESLAKVDHEHPAVVPAHSHEDLKRWADDAARQIDAIRDRIASVERRPLFEPSNWADVGHAHPPPKLPAHEHPHEHEIVGATPGLMDPSHVAELQSLRSELPPILERLDALQNEIKFVRGLAEKNEARGSSQKEHGYLSGGRLHDTVNERHAGFMTPDMKRKLEILWEKSESSQ